MLSRYTAPCRVGVGVNSAVTVRWGWGYSTITQLNREINHSIRRVRTVLERVTLPPHLPEDELPEAERARVSCVAGEANFKLMPWSHPEDVLPRGSGFSLYARRTDVNALLRPEIKVNQVFRGFPALLLRALGLVRCSF